LTHLIKQEFYIKTPHLIKQEFYIKTPHLIEQEFYIKTPHLIKQEFYIKTPHLMSFSWVSFSSPKSYIKKIKEIAVHATLRLLEDEGHFLMKGFFLQVKYHLSKY
jgi:hypothetical protein